MFKLIASNPFQDHQNRLFGPTRWRLALWYGGIMGAILSLCGLGVYHAVTYAHYLTIKQELESVANNLHEILEPILEQPGQLAPATQEILLNLCLIETQCLPITEERPRSILRHHRYYDVRLLGVCRAYEKLMSTMLNVNYAELTGRRLISNKFIEIDRTAAINLPSNMEGWLDRNSLARFVVEIVEQLDTGKIEGSYKGGGSAPYPPKMMLALLFYCYAKGIFASRQIEQATYELLPVLYITGGSHPDHDSINTFRKRFLEQLQPLFLQILVYAGSLGIFKLGDISIDGTKIQANASKHKAMSWEYANKLEVQLQAEVKALLHKSQTEAGETFGDIDIPQEIQRRQERLEKISQVKVEIEARAQARYDQEKAEYEAKLRERAVKEKIRGRKLGGKQPLAPEAGPKAKDQVNFTDGESRIMPVSGGGFEQAYNAQASVDMDTMLIVGNHVSQNPNDKQEVEPALAELNQLPENLGQVKRAALDAGYFSEDNTKQLEEEQIEPYIACGRQTHNLTFSERFAAEPEAPENPDALIAMKHRLKTEAGKQFYAKRKSTVEPVFGLIKEVMGFRRFMLRGINAVTGEWTLVCIAFNLKRLCTLSA